MKYLNFLRHAKSSWNSPETKDKNRPLNARGKRSCAIMAPHLQTAGVDFNHIYCSPARRARATIKRVAAAITDEDISWQTNAGLYTFTAEDVLRFCRGLEDTLSSALIVGHNPALTDCCNYLTAAGLANIPTCGYVAMQLDIENWRELTANCGKLQLFLYPKLYQ